MSLRHFMFRWRIRVKLKRMMALEFDREQKNKNKMVPYDYNTYMALATEVQARVKDDFQGMLLKHLEPCREQIEEQRLQIQK